MESGIFRLTAIFPDDGVSPPTGQCSGAVVEDAEVVARVVHGEVTVRVL